MAVNNLFKRLRGVVLGDGREVHGNGSAPYYVHADGGAPVELVAHARAAGRENLPHTNAIEPNDVETAVQREHERRHRDLVEHTRGVLRALEAEFEACEQALPTTDQLHVADQQAKAAIEHDLATEHALVPLRRERQARLRDLRKFIQDHRLGRPAHYPLSRVWHLSLVALVVVIESTLNAGLFSRGSAFGLIGGLVTAIGVSLINAVVGLLAGFFPFRWRHHLEPRLHRLAGAGIALYIVLALAFNWGVARFRDATAEGAERLQTADLLHHGASLSLVGAALFVIGCLASLVAARKGYTLDDRIPDFGERDRRFKEADEALNTYLETFRHRVLGRAHSVPQACEEIVREAAETVKGLGAIVVRAERSLEAYEAERERIERWSHQYLRRYRAENEAVRSTPTPQYFSSYPGIESQIRGDSTITMKARLKSAGTRLDQLRDEAHRIGLQQPERVAHARDRLESFLRDRFCQADSGRGDGSVDGGQRQNMAS